MATPIIDAYAESLGTVFLCAVPVAVVGFVVALFLKEVPLREMDAVSATDLGEGFGMPGTDSPEKILEVAVGRMFRDSPEIRLRRLAGGTGCELPVPQLWALLQIYRQNQVFGSATLVEIAERLRVPFEILQPTFDDVVRRGYALSAGGQERSDWGIDTGGQERSDRGIATGGQERSDRGIATGGQERSDRGIATGARLWLTQTGISQVNALSAAIVGRIVDKLAQSPSFDGRPDRAQVDVALERIAHRMLVQRDWTDDAKELVVAQN